MINTIMQMKKKSHIKISLHEKQQNLTLITKEKIIAKFSSNTAYNMREH